MNKLTFVFLLISFNIFCQSNVSNNSATMKWFDSLIGLKSTGLINGVYHIEKYNTIEGFDQYYKSPNFIIGNLYYDNQEYFNVNLLYDLYTDDLIFGFYDNDLLLKLKLVKDKVDFFSIDNKTFKKLLNEEYGIKGFYEVLLEEDELILYKKHYRKIFKILDSEKVYYKFIEKSDYYFYYQKTYVRLDNKKTINKSFPEKRKLINTYFSRIRYLSESNKDQLTINFFKNLIKN